MEQESQSHQAGVIALVLGALLAQADAGVPPPKVRSWKDAAKELHAPLPPEPEKLPRVLVYGAEWCGPCHKLQAWLHEHEVQFGYIDLERNSAGNARLADLKKHQHIKNGIPVLEIDGQLYEGFNESKLVTHLDSHNIAH